MSVSVETSGLSRQQRGNAPLLPRSWLSTALFLLGAVVAMLAYAYFDNRNHLITSFNRNASAEAQLSAKSVEMLIANVRDHLAIGAGNQDVISLKPQGLTIIDSIYEVGNPWVLSVSRLSKDMVITYTTPVASAIGADVSGQQHNRQIVERHEFNVSSPFTTVQGFEAVAVQVPIFRGDSFDGCLTALLDYDRIIKDYIKPLNPGGVSQMMVVDHTGAIIACSDQHTGHRGKSLAELGGKDLVPLAQAIGHLESGSTVIPNSGLLKNCSENAEICVTFVPVRFSKQSFWSICVIASKNDILLAAPSSNLPYFVAVLFAAMILVIAGILVGIALRYKTVLEIEVEHRAGQLQESREKYRNLVHSMGEGLCVSDPDGVCVYANPSMCRLVKMPEKELLGQKILVFLDRDSRDEFNAFMPKWKKGESTSLKAKLNLVDGTSLDVILNSTPRLDPQGNLEAVLILIHDVSDQVKAEEALLQQAEELKAITTAFPDMYFRRDQSGKFLSFQYDFSGRQPQGFDQPLESHFAEMPAAVVKELNAKLQRALEQQQHESIEYSLPNRNHFDYFEARLVSVEGDQVLGIIRNITERKRAELVQQVLLDIAEAAIRANNLEELARLIHGKLGQVIDTKNFFVALYNESNDTYSFPFASDQYDIDFSPQSLPNSLTDYVRRTGKPLFVDQELNGKLRSTGKIEVIGPSSPYWLGAPLKSGGVTIGVVVVQSYDKDSPLWASDLELLTYVSDHIALAISRKKAEDALRQSETTYRRLVEVAQESIITVDAKDIITFVNKAFSEAIGYPRYGLVGRPLVEILHDSSVEQVLAETKKREQGQSATYEIRFVSADDEILHFLCTATPLEGQHGEFEGTLAVMVEITERKKSEEALLHTQKLESLGVMAGGIAHDFNNLLVAIMGNASLALSETGKDSPIYQYLLDLESASQRAADLTHQMLAYSGKGKFTIETFDLSHTVREMGRLLSAAIPKPVNLHMHLIDRIPAIEGDLAQIQQVVMNLIINAAEAIGEKGGDVHVTTGTIKVDDDYLKSAYLSDDLIVGNYVFLEIADNGCGMDTRTADRIFDPFFTTKFTGRGLGLAAVLGIIRGHKGAIKVYSSPGVGSTFRVLLPTSGEIEAAAPETNGQHLVPKLKGTILVIDDEPSIRSVVERTLRTSGMKVLSAGNGQEGLDVFARHSDSIDLVLIDMVMPGISSEDALSAIKAISPGVKTVLTSGYSEFDAVSRFENISLNGFLQKPFSPSMLVSAIQQGLAGDSP